MNRFHSPARLAAAAAVTALLLAACATPKPARMERPAGLQGLAEERLEGAGAGRSGRWRLAGLEGEFERTADRLGLFDVVSRDRASVRLTWRTPAGQSGELSCKAAQTEATAGIAQATVRPFAVECTMRAAQADRPERTGTLRLEGRAAAGGTRQERSGRWNAGDVSMDIHSVHRVEGSPLPLEAPFGYVLSRAGTPVAAVELDGLRPRLWRPSEGTASRDDATVALVALALLWDPAR
ncbi:MAG: hypothetical protein JNN03_16685 [Rubrivivax sp.]|nr:hypothetical protein [Rubrivivax sp.]